MGTCFFENFGKNRFTIDNRVFRVFVEIPIGKILALFDVFSATLEGGGSGSGLWEKWLKKVKFRLVNYEENDLKNEKKSDFFPIDNMIISRKVDNF